MSEELENTTAEENKETHDSVEKTESGSAKKPTGKKSKKLMYALLAVAAVVVLVVALNASKIVNAAVKLFTSPEAYYHHVEEKAAENLVEWIAEVYEQQVHSLFSFDDVGRSAEFTVEFGEDVRGLLEEETSMDFDWLEALSFFVSTDSLKSASKAEVGISLNQKQLLSLLMMYNVEDGIGYAQIPELNEDYLGIEIEEFCERYGLDMDRNDINEIYSIFDEIYDNLPDQKKVEKIMKRYSSLVISCIENVKQDTEEVNVGDLSKKYTVLTATIDEETLQKMCEEMIKELKKDKDIKEILTDILSLQDEIDSKDVYEEFQNLLEEAEDEIEALSKYDFEIEWKTYVDNEGTIVGRAVEIEGVEISSLFVHTGGKFAYEFNVSANGANVALEGSGKMNNRELNGDFKLKVMGMTVVKLRAEDVKVKELKDGYFNGNVEISLAGMVASLIDSSEAGLPVSVGDLKLKTTMKNTESESSFKISLCEKEDLLAAVSVMSKNGKANKVKFPAKNNVVMIEDQSDLMEWVGGIDLEGFLEELKKTVGDDVVELLEDVINDEIISTP